ncbi:MAG: ComF family protein [Armatimonadetes bacterium]|nr:ComF family protein [Armatimonadota bacterium]
MRLWFLDRWLTLLFPIRCVLCRTRGERAVCQRCWDAFPRIADACPRCDHPATGAGWPTTNCADCARGAFTFVQARALGPHEGALRRAIIRLKFSGAWRVADVLAERMAERVREAWPGLGFDAVVAVPMTAERLRERGFNQAALLAGRVAVRLGIRHQAGWLARRPTDQRQSTLARGMRRRHARGAFLAVVDKLAGRRVLLVDDVMTTGATVGACARALTARGATVWVLVAARGVLRKECVNK